MGDLTARTLVHTPCMSMFYVCCAVHVRPHGSSDILDILRFVIGLNNFRRPSFHVSAGGQAGIHQGYIKKYNDIYVISQVVDPQFMIYTRTSRSYREGRSPICAYDLRELPAGHAAR